MGINREKFLARNGLVATAKLDFNTIAQMSGIPVNCLTAVYNRGVADWLSNPKHKKDDKLFNKNAKQRQTYLEGYKQALDAKGMDRLFAFLEYSPKSLKLDRDMYDAFGVAVPEKKKKAKLEEPKDDSDSDYSDQSL